MKLLQAMKSILIKNKA